MCTHTYAHSLPTLTTQKRNKGRCCLLQRFWGRRHSPRLESSKDCDGPTCRARWVCSQSSPNAGCSPAHHLPSGSSSGLVGSTSDGAQAGDPPAAVWPPLSPQQLEVLPVLPPSLWHPCSPPVMLHELISCLASTPGPPWQMQRARQARRLCDNLPSDLGFSGLSLQRTVLGAHLGTMSH